MTNVFKISYLNKIAELFKEAFTLKKYKAMNPVLAVFCGILMIPFVLFSFFVAVILFCLAFPFDTFSSLVKSLHMLLKEEGQDVKHATQFIVYWISWPIVFSLYIMEYILLLWMVPTYALLAFLVYIWSFGGVKLHLFAREEDDIGVEVTGRYGALPIVLVIVGYALNFVMPLIHCVIYYLTLYFQYQESLFSYYNIVMICSPYHGMALLATFVFALIMAAYPKTKNTLNK